MSGPHDQHAGGRAWLARNGAAVLVAAGAAAATAHGLYEVAEASKVPAGIAWLYPVITDGLGAVAYSATSRLRGKAAGYAWSCVVLAAGLSGLAQAVYLAADTVAADPVLRFGVGAWPAIACALVAHLLHLTLTTNQHQQHDAHHDGDQHNGQNDNAQGDGHHSTRGPAVQLDAAAPMAALPVGPVTDIGADIGGGFGADISDGGDDADLGADQDHDRGESGDARVRLLRELLAAGVDVTGPQTAALLSHRAGSVVSDRTARRLLAAARDPEQHTSHATKQDTGQDAGQDAGRDDAGQQPRDRARLVLLPTGTTTRSDNDHHEGDQR